MNEHAAGLGLARCRYVRHRDLTSAERLKYLLHVFFLSLPRESAGARTLLGNEAIPTDLP
jgi:hypothetical protein